VAIDNKAARPKSRGKPFAKGNPGRKPGSKNRSTRLVEALGTVDATQLVQKSYELACSGNVPLMKFWLERLLPRERLVELDLASVIYAEDAVVAHANVLRGVTEGQITPSEGAAISAMIGASARAIEIEDVVHRLDSMEAEFKKAARL
jgi:hypothetical protein